MPNFSLAGRRNAALMCLVIVGIYCVELLFV
uniref:Uncharacterized protein n=1 Tax=Arundo donax TaxID=35708 RepID=A0A0A9A5P6_ARUDO